MITREFQGVALPMLGVGLMRLPIIDGKLSHIDEPQTAQMISYAMEHGSNYFDTAWQYHNGNSERLAGKLLSQYPRDSFLLADKFPGYDLSNMDKVEEIFEEQLKRCQVDYFDYYLLHNVCELNIDDYLDEKHGIMSYLARQKDKGRIKHLGFSNHGSNDTIDRFLKVYGNEMEFCQLQLNWIDWTLQGGKEKVDLVSSYGLAVWVMEPLRGGRLASLSDSAEAQLGALRPDEGIPAWSFRFLQTIPQVALILGGMSSLEQMKENVAAFAEERPLNDEEMSTLLGIADELLGGSFLPCTSCHYCTSYCPQELDIPFILELFNQRSFTGEGDFVSSMALASLPKDKQPDACSGCKSCEAVCPQQLKIADAMREFATLVG